MTLQNPKTSDNARQRGTNPKSGKNAKNQLRIKSRHYLHDAYQQEKQHRWHNHHDFKFSFHHAMPSNFYSTTAGSFIETGLASESGSSNLFIINPTLPNYTTAGSLIQSYLFAQSISRNWFLINKSSFDQRPPVRLIKPNPNPDGNS